jgi:hypothetical protein
MQANSSSNRGGACTYMLLLQSGRKIPCCCWREYYTRVPTYTRRGPSKQEGCIYRYFDSTVNSRVSNKTKFSDLNFAVSCIIVIYNVGCQHNRRK